MATATFAGLATGIDTSGLIDALIEARESENISRKAQISHLESENSALEELNTRFLALRDLIDEFRTVNGGGMKRKAQSSNTDVATATAQASAVNSTTSLTVISLADTATASFNPAVSYTAESSYLSTAAGTGDVKVIVGEGSDQKTVTVSVTGNSTTIRQFVDAVNSNSNAAGRLSASLVNVETESSPNYKVVFNSLETGTGKGKIAFDIAALHQASVGAPTIDQATNAQLSIGGITGTIQREGNLIDDLVPGVTLQLLDDGAATISVSNDSEATAEMMGKIVEAYNDIVEYINENNLVTEKRNEKGTVQLTYGALAKTRLDDEFLNRFKLELSQAESTNGTKAKKMSELGLSTNRDGTISLDVAKFKEVLSSDSLGASEVLADFADAVAGTVGFLSEYTKFKGLIDLAQDGNDAEIENINQRIEQVERSAQMERERLNGTFSRLERQTAEMQQKQAELTAVISSFN